jgi:ABC-type multidrug transport system ATPase subunit
VTPILAVRNLGARYGRRTVFTGVSFEVGRGRALGVLGPNGAGKTNLLRVLAGLLRPAAGEVRIDGGLPPAALATVAVAYFGGEATLPGIVQAARWSSLTTGVPVVREPRPIRTLSRWSRQMLGLRTVLARHPLALVLLDEPWEGLDPDGARWLSSTLEAKRDRGAAVVLASHYLQDLAGVCDEYLFLVGSQPTLLKAHEIAPVGPVSPALLTEVYDRLRGGPPTQRLSRSALTA